VARRLTLESEWRSPERLPWLRTFDVARLKIETFEDFLIRIDSIVNDHSVVEGPTPRKALSDQVGKF
jgi:hypothetical protein